jgi:hypothetical protein
MPPVGPLTVADVLGGGDPGRAAAALERGLERADVAEDALKSVGTVGAAAYRLVDQRVAQALGGQLDTDLGGLILDGWLKYRELVAAAARTRDSPGQREDVVLTEHEITSTHHPTVDVIVDGAVVCTLAFELTVSLVLRGVIAMVERGRLTALRGGDLVAGACISLSGRELARGEYRCVVGLVVRLGDGVVLAPAVATPAPASTWSRSTGQHPTERSNRWWERSEGGGG